MNEYTDKEKYFFYKDLCFFQNYVESLLFKNVLLDEKSFKKTKI